MQHPSIQRGAVRIKPKINAIGREPQVMKGVIAVILLMLSFSLSGCLTDGTSDNSESCDYVVVPDFHMETANRTEIELNYTNESGWFRLSEHRDKVIILDFMAKDAANSHHVQHHIESKLEEWNNLGGFHPVMVVSIGSWYPSETLQYLNESSNNYDPPNWILGIGNDSSVILNEIDGIYGDLNQNYEIQAIPITMIIDHEGYLIHTERTGTPADQWESFDDAVESSILGNSERYCLNN